VVRELGEAAHDVRPGADDRRGGFGRRAAGEDRQAAEGGPVGRVEEVVRPADGGLEGTVAIAGPASVGQLVGAVAELGDDLGRRTGDAAGGGQLDR
jgi:hypothetical protein